MEEFNEARARVSFSAFEPATGEFTLNVPASADGDVMGEALWESVCSVALGVSHVTTKSTEEGRSKLQRRRSSSSSQPKFFATQDTTLTWRVHHPSLDVCVCFH